MRRSSTTTFIGLLTLAASAACVTDRTPTGTTPPPDSGPPMQVGDTVKVRISNFAFVLPDLQVKLGAVLQWTNEDSAIHTVTDEGSLFDSNAFGLNKQYALKATRTGTFQYFCGVHPFMRGKFTVTN